VAPPGYAIDVRPGPGAHLRDDGAGARARPAQD
jgi:hypothetical protein